MLTLTLYIFIFFHNLYVYAYIIFCSSNFFFFFFATFCVVYTCVNMCATSLYLVNKLVTCCYSIQQQLTEQYGYLMVTAWLLHGIIYL